MKLRYRLIQRKNGLFYLFDRQTSKRESLETSDLVEGVSGRGSGERSSPAKAGSYGPADARSNEVSRKSRTVELEDHGAGSIPRRKGVSDSRESIRIW